MRIGAGVLAVLAALLQPSAAMDAAKVKEFLVGTWAVPMGAETWVFSQDGVWDQFAAGRHNTATYDTEAMPANLFVLISSSGKRYVAHTANDGSAFRLFMEGTTEEVGFFWRQKD